MRIRKERIARGRMVSLLLVAMLLPAVTSALVTDFDLNPGAMGIGVDASGRIWVSTFNQDAVIGFREDQFLVDQDVLVIPRCENPRYVTLGPLGTRGYTASWDRYNPGDVVIFDLATGEVLAVLDQGPDDCHFNAVVAPDESWLYFANYYGGSVTKIARPGGIPEEPVNVGSWPANLALTPDGRYLYAVYDQWSVGGTGLRIIDTAANSVVNTHTFAIGVHDLKFSADGSRLYAGAPGSGGGGQHYMYVLDASDPTAPVEIDTVDVGGQPYGVAVCDSVVAVGTDDGRICFINIRCDDNNVIGWEEVGGSLRYGDIHEGKAYFANHGVGTIVHIANVPPCGVVVPYEEDFEADPGWLTNNPSHYYVSENSMFGYGVSDSWEYCTVPVSSHPGTFVLEWDSYCDRSDWSSGTAFGLLGCGRPITGSTEQYIHVTYNHDDGGYFIRLHVCDDSGYAVESSSHYYDFIGRWMHNSVTYDPSTGTAACSASDGGQLVASFEITGLSGFDENLCQLGLSVCHDYAVGGQVTSLYVDNVAFNDLAATGVDADESPVVATSPQNLPNPFNAATMIAFDLAVGGDVHVSIYDPSGRLVRTLVDESVQMGSHRRIWDGTDDEGRRVSSGVYFYRIDGPGLQEQRKMVKLW